MHDKPRLMPIQWNVDHFQINGTTKKQNKPLLNQNNRAICSEKTKMRHPIIYERKE